MSVADAGAVADTERDAGASRSQADSEASYGQILKSSSIVGGAQVVNMIVGLVRTKLVAVLIGPVGIGLVGIYVSIITLASTLARMGIQTSGVREVATHYGERNEPGIAAAAKTLWRLCWLNGVAGMILLAMAAPWISMCSFGGTGYTLPIALLSVTVLFSNLVSSQSAILQGTRRIGDIARVQVVGALAGTVVSVAMYAWLGVVGIVPALIALSAISLAASTYYFRKLPMAKVDVTWKQSFVEGGSLLKFGASTMTAGLSGAGATFATRAILSNEIGLQAVGIYTAAFTLSGMFVQFVLQAMGTDFYPRLTAVSKDHSEMGRLINQQTEVGLLLAFPGLLATLALAPLVITVFYTLEFAPAADMLKWFLIGCIGRVLSWPLSYGILAKGHGKLFAITEAVFHALHVALVFLFMQRLGLVGAAIAFAFLYIGYTIALLAITHATIQFSWSRNVLGQLVWMVPLAAACFLLSILVTPAIAIPIGCIASLTSGVLCLHQLIVRLGTEHYISRKFRQLTNSLLCRLTCLFR